MRVGGGESFSADFFILESNADGNFCKISKIITAIALP
jgi:hypothetical protein